MRRSDGTPSPDGEEGIATCSVAELGTTIQLTAAGELDFAAAPLLRAAAEQVALSSGRVLVLDLCDTTFVDGSVVHFAMGLQRRADAHGAVLVVVAPRRAKALFELLGAGDLRIVEDAARTVAAGAAG